MLSGMFGLVTLLGTLIGFVLYLVISYRLDRVGFIGVLGGLQLLLESDSRPIAYLRRQHWKITIMLTPGWQMRN